jgi:Spy/CpxP family protein refolding chaperone
MALLGLLVGTVGTVHAQAPDTAASAKARSLPADEVSSLLAGEGMGQASAAEFNHYPGPRHLLDVADQIGLSAGQKDAIRQIYLETIDQARKTGSKMVDKEAELSAAFAQGKITEDRLRALVAEIAELHGQLRLIHLAAHLKTRPLLSAEQVTKYEKLRGYTEN